MKNIGNQSIVRTWLKKLKSKEQLQKTSRQLSGSLLSSLPGASQVPNSFPGFSQEARAQMLPNLRHMRLKQRAAHVSFRRLSSAFVLTASFCFREAHMFNAVGGQTVVVVVVVVGVVVVFVVAAFIIFDGAVVFAFIVCRSVFWWVPFSLDQERKEGEERRPPDESKARGLGFHRAPRLNGNARTNIFLIGSRLISDAKSSYGVTESQIKKESFQRQRHTCR